MHTHTHTHTRGRGPPRPSILAVWGRGRDGAGGWPRPGKPEESSGASRPSAGPPSPPRCGPVTGRGGGGGTSGAGSARRERRGGWGADTHLPRPGRPPPAAGEEDATVCAAGAGTAEDEDDAAEAGAAPGDESRPPPGLRPLAGAGGCGCGFSDMVSGPYTGSHAGRGQPGAGRAEQTPERGGDARTPSGQARAGAVAGARGSRTTTKGRGGPQTPNSRREPGRDAPLPLLPKQSEAQGGERGPRGGAPGPRGGGPAEGYVAAPPRPPRRAVRGSERRAAQPDRRGGSGPAEGRRAAAADGRMGTRLRGTRTGRRGPEGAERCGTDLGAGGRG